MSERGFYIYYVEAACVTPAEPHPGIYFAFGNEPHGPFSSRQAAYEAWMQLRSESSDEFILEPRGDVKP